MSMHKIPLTDLEHEGLIKHHLPIGKPSQLSDCFRAGVQWVIRSIQECENENNRLYMEGRPQEEKLKLKLALSEASVRSLKNLIPRLKEIPMQLIKENMALQAKIDALMMEYCPSEMTAEQIENWEKHQVVSNHQCDHSLVTRDNLYIMTGDQLDKFSQLLSGGLHPRHLGESDKDFRKRLITLYDSTFNTISNPTPVFTDSTRQVK